jgi:hypothetical protein
MFQCGYFASEFDTGSGDDRIKMEHLDIQSQDHLVSLLPGAGTSDLRGSCGLTRLSLVEYSSTGEPH